MDQLRKKLIRTFSSESKTAEPLVNYKGAKTKFANQKNFIDTLNSEEDCVVCAFISHSDIFDLPKNELTELKKDL
jgi:hypothetical protein